MTPGQWLGVLTAGAPIVSAALLGLGWAVHALTHRTRRSTR